MKELNWQVEEDLNFVEEDNCLVKHTFQVEF